MYSQEQIQAALSELSENQKQYAAWLATPEPMRQPKRKEVLAEELGVSSRTLRRWDHKESVNAVVLYYMRRQSPVQRLSSVIDGLMVRARKTEGTAVREANEAAEILLKWIHGENIGANFNFKQETNVAQNQQEQGVDPNELTPEQRKAILRAWAGERDHEEPSNGAADPPAR